MKELHKLLDRIVQRVNINLRELEFDVNPLVNTLIPAGQMTKFYAFYGITPHHALNLVFKHSNLSGSYFLGKVRVTNSLLYKSDIRGDELKKNGDLFQYQDFNIPVDQDEEISIEDSFLIKTLVHNYSHDPETLETFFIKDTVSTHYANIHGSPSDGSFLGPFATVDLTTIRDCVIGAYSYVQAGEVSHLSIDPGTVWVRKPGDFNFMYRYPLDQLSNYVYFAAGSPPQGVFMDFLEDRKEAFERVFNVVNIETPESVPASASLDRFAVIKPKTRSVKTCWWRSGPSCRIRCSERGPMPRKTATSSTPSSRATTSPRTGLKSSRRTWARTCSWDSTLFSGAAGRPDHHRPGMRHHAAHDRRCPQTLDHPPRPPRLGFGPEPPGS